MNHLLPSLSVRNFLVASFLVLSAYGVVNRNWLNTRYPLQMDANGYYIYLPAIFIYHDLERLSFVDEMPEQFDRKYFLYPGVQGGYMTKYTPGMAILELPFFLAGHLAAKISGLETNGYSPPYRLAIAISSIFYSCLGLWVLFLVLTRYFEERAVLATIAMLLTGTNLLFYSVIQPAITHNYVFFVVCLLLYFIERWYHGGRWQDFGFACACVGFCALIRPTEVLVGLIPAGYFLRKWKTRNFSFPAIKDQLKSILTGILAFLFFLFPVFVYWKFSTGNWVAYTYEQEGFYFDRPWQIWLGLFGFRKGWFIYTPLLFLSLWGLFSLWRQERFAPFRSGFLFYIPFNLYIVLSWYGWWYGGCFGLRALIPALALMAFPLALLLEEARKFRFLIIGLAFFFSFLNVFQSFQYQRRVLHMDAMTWRAYLFVFGKWTLTDAEKAHLETLLDHPDYGQRGKKLDEYFK